MYKFLLTWRYLLTRYIALVSVISVTLGVATMIVVNAVMLGFSKEMENRSTTDRCDQIPFTGAGWSPDSPTPCLSSLQDQRDGFSGVVLDRKCVVQPRTASLNPSPGVHDAN